MIDINKWVLTLEATCFKASTFKFLFKVGFMMNSLSLASDLIDFWNWDSSFSTASKALLLEAAENKADAYLPSKPNTCTGGLTSWAAADEVLSERTCKLRNGKSYVNVILLNFKYK